MAAYLRSVPADRPREAGVGETAAELESWMT
jgi:hypothetical protein